MTVQDQIIENKDIYHSAIYGTLMAAGVLDLMNKKIFEGLDPLELQKLDAKKTTVLLNFQNPVFLNKILESDKSTLEFRQVMKTITDATEKLIDLTKEALTSIGDK